MEWYWIIAIIFGYIVMWAICSIIGYRTGLEDGDIGTLTALGLLWPIFLPIFSVFWAVKTFGPGR